ncbi:hypothetical protein [Xanthomonas campestris]|uniref:hypothetical protein n=1 Tax=Xanthomonas campestris TaxID=339 RepID=UPI0023E9D883|nr:hypothetical protein [Xanthomonas campestris]
MGFNPLTIVGTLIGGLILAGILGWMKKPRLVAFVPKLFAHSRISDNGQIAEIWFMNRGLKNEEQIEAIFNPRLRYELIGSNNPNITLEREKLSIPRIGAGDDCSVLLQIEGGKFSQEDIVSCLSKETKGSITSKLDEVPVTWGQRVGLVAFVIVFGSLLTLAFKGFDWYLDKENKEVVDTKNLDSEHPQEDEMNGWQVGDHYRDNTIWKAIAQRKIIITVSESRKIKQRVKLAVGVSNASDEVLSITLSIAASGNQSSIPYQEKNLFDRLLMPNQAVEHTLSAQVDSNDSTPRALIEVFIETADGETLKAKKLIAVN